MCGGVGLIILFNKTGFFLQKFKFPVYLPYVLVSIFSISVLMLFKTDRFIFLICFLGKNSIVFYVTQGISSSLLYYISNYLDKFNFILHLCLSFLINIFISLAIGMLFIKMCASYRNLRVKLITWLQNV